MLLFTFDHLNSMFSFTLIHEAISEQQPVMLIEQFNECATICSSKADKLSSAKCYFKAVFALSVGAGRRCDQ